MALILNIDTATAVCSVALAKEGSVIALRESHSSNEHSSVISSFIEGVISDAGMALDRIDAVSVSMGPGSYTGLRIGVATAKGLCYALDRPLIAIPTLLAMAWGMRERTRATNLLSESPAGGEVLFCPMIDARRMEVYAAFYNQDLTEVRETKAEIIDEQFAAGPGTGQGIVFAR